MTGTAATGRGRLGATPGSKTPKDIWIYPLSADARRQLQDEPPEPVVPCKLEDSLQAADWCGQELEKIDLGDVRLDRRAESMLEARWKDPSATFGASFPEWADAKAAYGLIENKSPRIALRSLLHPHCEATLARM